MTITIELPDDTVAQLIARAQAQGRSAPDLAAEAIRQQYPPAPDAIQTRQRSLLAFAGSGKGKPGAHPDDVQNYLDVLRDEWDQKRP